MEIPCHIWLVSSESTRGTLLLLETVAKEAGGVKQRFLSLRLSIQPAAKKISSNKQQKINNSKFYSWGKLASLVPFRSGSDALVGLFLSVLLLYYYWFLNRPQRQEVAAISFCAHTGVHCKVNLSNIHRWSLCGGCCYNPEVLKLFKLRAWKLHEGFFFVFVTVKLFICCLHLIVTFHLQLY